MKCKMIVDKTREEELLLFVKEDNEGARRLLSQIEELLAEEQKLVGYKDGSILTLSPCDVFCFTVEDGRVYAITEKDRLLMKMRLYVIEDMLGADFVRINQSCIANIKKIERFETSIGASLLVRFKNGYKDYVSRRQLRAVKERIGFKL